MIVHDYVNLYNEITEERSERLKRLPYKKFLETDYWRIISGYVKQRDHNECVQCSETHNLQVHHLTYENRGYEYRTHETDLVTLCNECHSALHNIKPKPVKKPRVRRNSSQSPEYSWLPALRQKQKEKQRDRQAVEEVRQYLSGILVKHMESQISKTLSWCWNKTS